MLARTLRRPSPPESPLPSPKLQRPVTPLLTRHIIPPSTTPPSITPPSESAQEVKVKSGFTFSYENTARKKIFSLHYGGKVAEPVVSAHDRNPHPIDKVSKWLDGVE